MQVQNSYCQRNGTDCSQEKYINQHIQIEGGKWRDKKKIVMTKEGKFVVPVGLGREPLSNDVAYGSSGFNKLFSIKRTGRVHVSTMGGSFDENSWQVTGQVFSYSQGMPRVHRTVRENDAGDILRYIFPTIVIIGTVDVLLHIFITNAKYLLTRKGIQVEGYERTEWLVLRVRRLEVTKFGTSLVKPLSI